jgi:hypothetical protein
MIWASRFTCMLSPDARVCGEVVPVAKLSIDRGHRPPVCAINWDVGGVLGVVGRTGMPGNDIRSGSTMEM